jgi:hypothetical protein
VEEGKGRRGEGDDDDEVDGGYRAKNSSLTKRTMTGWIQFVSIDPPTVRPIDQHCCSATVAYSSPDDRRDSNAEGGGRVMYADMVERRKQEALNKPILSLGLCALQLRPLKCRSLVPDRGRCRAGCKSNKH